MVPLTTPTRAVLVAVLRNTKNPPVFNVPAVTLNLLNKFNLLPIVKLPPVPLTIKSPKAFVPSVVTTSALVA